MENQASVIELLFEKTERYARTSAELFKLKAIDKSADMLSALAVRLAIILFMTMFFLILNIGIALWIGEALGKSYYGFFSMAGFYAIVGILLYTFRNKWIKEPLRNSLIEQALN